MNENAVAGIKAMAQLLKYLGALSDGPKGMDDVVVFPGNEMRTVLYFRIWYRKKWNVAIPLSLRDCKGKDIKRLKQLLADRFRDKINEITSEEK